MVMCSNFTIQSQRIIGLSLPDPYAFSFCSPGTIRHAPSHFKHIVFEYVISETLKIICIAHDRVNGYNAAITVGNQVRLYLIHPGYRCISKGEETAIVCKEACAKNAIS